MLKLVSTTLALYYHIMKSISSTQSLTVSSLLQESYSLCQIESKTCLEKSTIGKIKKQLDIEQENNKGGYPSKLFTIDKYSIIQQITSGKLDNATDVGITKYNMLSLMPKDYVYYST